MSSPCQIATAASPNCQQWMTTSNYVPPIVSCVECFKGVVHQLLQWLQASPWACSFANMSASVSIYSYSLYHLYLTVSPSTSLSLSLSPSLSVSLSVCLPVVSICLPIDPSIHPSIHYLWTHLSILHTWVCVTSTDSLLYIDVSFRGMETSISSSGTQKGYNMMVLRWRNADKILVCAETENPPWAQLRL